MTAVALALLLQGDAARLIEDLKSEDLEVRERATRALVELGRAALPSLDEAVRGGDPEVRPRARRASLTIRYGGLGAGAPWTLPRWREKIGDALAREGPERWTRLRELGLRISDEEFRNAEAEAAKGKKLIWAILRRWSAREPRAAADWCHAQVLFVPADTDDLLECLARAVSDWAGRDKAAAKAWVLELPEGAGRRLLLDLNALK